MSNKEVDSTALSAAHFVWVEADLSNLLCTVQWLRRHDAAARQVACNAQRYAGIVLTPRVLAEAMRDSIICGAS